MADIVDALNQSIEHAWQQHDAMERRALAAEARAREYRQLFFDWASHDYACPANWPDAEPCKCGYEAERARLVADHAADQNPSVSATSLDGTESGGIE